MFTFIIEVTVVTSWNLTNPACVGSKVGFGVFVLTVVIVAALAISFTGKTVFGSTFEARVTAQVWFFIFVLTNSTDIISAA